MNTKLFVGNISWNSTEEDVKSLFEGVGEVVEVKLIIDKFRGTHKGFGFVTMATPEDAQKAKEQLDGHELDGRELNVSDARPREERDDRQEQAAA